MHVRSLANYLDLLGCGGRPDRRQDVVDEPPKQKRCNTCRRPRDNHHAELCPICLRDKEFGDVR